MYRLLIVEDDLENCDILARNFERTGGYSCFFTHNAQEALAAVAGGPFDLILLDIMLPGMDGIDLCVQLRASCYCPILFISCLDDDASIVRALRMGGDDYITKPFRFPVLLAHTEAALRRIERSSATRPPQTEYTIGEKRLSTTEHLVRHGETKIFLSPTEFDLLLLFVQNPETVLLFEDIYQHIWKRPSLGDLRTVFSHVRNLRKKLEQDPSNPRHIVTMARIGYIFHP